MPAFHTEVAHQLGRDAAIDRLKGFVQQVERKFKDQVSRLEGDWEDNQLQFSMTTYGFELSGVLTVDDNKAVIDGKLPFPAVAFRGKIEKSFQKELEKALAS